MSEQAQSSSTPKTVEDLLQEVTEEVSKFEALKLNDLKTQLDAFVKKKKAAVAEYENKYGGLKQIWDEQGKRIEELLHDLKCAFPDEKRQKLIKDCICKKLEELNKAKAHIECRNACKGIKEEQRDNAKAEMESAQTDIVAWEAAPQRIQAQLTENQKAIDEIKRLMQGPDRVIGIYLLWFKLIPGYNLIRPSEELQFEDEVPEKLCPESGSADTPTQGRCSECWPDQPQQKTNNSQAKSAEPPRSTPWLIAKDQYAGKLDEVWNDYRQKKDAFAEKEKDFIAHRDDLATKKSQYEDDKKSLDDRIKNALKEAVSAVAQ